jgi:hypothetical protein
MNTTTKAAGIAAVALVGYDTLVRSRILNWGATSAERRMQLPGDDIASGMPPDYTKAVTIQAPPEAVWPWLAQIGDHRAGFYSYDWIERFLFLGTVHYIEGTHSATRIHPELQQVHVGDPINTGTVGKVAVGNPVTVLEPGRALVIGTWAFILQPLPGDRDPAAGPQPRLGLPAARRPAPACAAADSAQRDRLPHRRPAALRHGTRNDARPQTARRIRRHPTRSRRIRRQGRPSPCQQPAIAWARSRADLYPTG